MNMSALLLLTLVVGTFRSLQLHLGGTDMIRWELMPRLGMARL